MKRNLLILLTLAFFEAPSPAREWGTHWISHPCPDDTSQVWFRKRIATPVALAKGFITLASRGYFRLYVNERNVTTDPFLNQAGTTPGATRQYTFDVTRFLDAKENVIAVWYAPRPESPSDKQLSLDFYGSDTTGRPFFDQADKTWLCKNASASTPATDSEDIDGEAYSNTWLSTDESDWRHPSDSRDTTTTRLLNTSPLYDGIRVRQVLGSVAEQEDSTGITFDFGRTFRGWVRITLRNARKGERLTFGTHSYTCGARMDEQAFPRFTITEQRFVTITGDENFRREQIQSVEGLEVDHYPHTHYIY